MMLRQFVRAILLIMVLAPASAETGKTTITLRILDGKTGGKVTPDNIQVRLKSTGKIDTTWVRQGDDGDAAIAIPDGVTSISFRATYDSSMAYYVDCDVARQKDTTSESWYPVADILSAGIKITNDCLKPKEADKLNNVTVKPGEFVLFVRKKNWLEGAQE
jgi:hypothetical protein